MSCRARSQVGPLRQLVGQSPWEACRSTCAKGGRFRAVNQNSEIGLAETDFLAGYVGCVSRAGCSPPIWTIETPRVVARVCRGIDAELCPLEVISSIYLGWIDERVPLWMPPNLHLMDQTGEFFHTLDRMLYCIGQLVAADERVPYLDSKGIDFSRASLSGDPQRRSAQPVSIHCLLPERPGRVHVSPTDGEIACLYSAWVKISLLLLERIKNLRDPPGGTNVEESFCSLEVTQDRDDRRSRQQHDRVNYEEGAGEALARKGRMIKRRVDAFLPAPHHIEA